MSDGLNKTSRKMHRQNIFVYNDLLIPGLVLRFIQSRIGCNKTKDIGFDNKYLYLILC